MNHKHDKDQQDKVIIASDPFASREAEKYTNPIPSREYILSVFQQFNEPLSFNKLKQQLAMHNEQDKLALRRRLKAMVRDGQLQKKSKTYYLRESTFPDNYNDILNCEYDESNLKKVVGNLFNVNGFNYVAPFLNKDLTQEILIPRGYENDAQIGDCVVVAVVLPVFKWADPIGKVINVLGKFNHKEVLINAAIMSLEIPHVWDPEIKREITKIDPELRLELIKSRVDLRDLNFVTIDGEDAKDFDDAVYCEALPKKHWKLYVAIADVSHYVNANTAIDLQANLRGNSVYFPGKVIPMLPELLANQLCSLQPNVARLAMICEIEISSSGKLTKYKFYEGVICSKARLTYNQVEEFLNQRKDKALHKGVKSNLLALHDLYQVLRKQRTLRGAIDFETVESKVIFNKKGLPIDIKVFKRNIAHKIIEECMLCANVASAKFLQQHKLLSIYRVHEGPKAVKLLDLKAFLAGVGLSLDSAEINPTPKDYAKLLQSIADRSDAEVIQMILLRSMCQAVYSIDNIGHFGLAYAAYTHFTSPIRRYTDLLVHRHIKLILHNQQHSINIPQLTEELAKIAEHCSNTERRADEASREVIKACKCQYLTKYIGNSFNGIICGVTKFGLFVEIKDIYVDGLVHINSLGEDYFLHDPVHHKLIGERTGKIYSLGMELKVILVKVDLDKRRIDFVLTENLKKTKNSLNKAKSDHAKNKSIHRMKTKKIKITAHSKQPTSKKVKQKIKSKSKHKNHKKI